MYSSYSISFIVWYILLYSNIFHFNVILMYYIISMVSTVQHLMVLICYTPPTGFHGGSTTAEISTPLVFISPLFQPITPSSLLPGYMFEGKRGRVWG